MELIGREKQNTFPNHISDKSDRYSRAKTIDKVFAAAQTVKIDDKSIVYQSASLMDRYYQMNYKKDDMHMNLSDSYLTGFTSLFIASKNSEVEPLNIKDIMNHFL